MNADEAEQEPGQKGVKRRALVVDGDEAKGGQAAGAAAVAQARPGVVGVAAAGGNGGADDAGGLAREEAIARESATIVAELVASGLKSRNAHSPDAEPAISVARAWISALEKARSILKATSAADVTKRAAAQAVLVAVATVLDTNLDAEIEALTAQADAIETKACLGALNLALPLRAAEATQLRSLVAAAGVDIHVDTTREVVARIADARAKQRAELSERSERVNALIETFTKLPVVNEDVKAKSAELAAQRSAMEATIKQLDEAKGKERSAVGTLNAAGLECEAHRATLAALVVIRGTAKRQTATVLAAAKGAQVRQTDNVRETLEQTWNTRDLEKQTHAMVEVLRATRLAIATYRKQLYAYGAGGDMGAADNMEEVVADDWDDDVIEAAETVAMTQQAIVKDTATVSRINGAGLTVGYFQGCVDKIDAFIKESFDEDAASASATVACADKLRDRLEALDAKRAASNVLRKIDALALAHNAEIREAIRTLDAYNVRSMFKARLAANAASAEALRAVVKKLSNFVNLKRKEIVAARTSLTTQEYTDAMLDAAIAGGKKASDPVDGADGKVEKSDLINADTREEAIDSIPEAIRTYMPDNANDLVAAWDIATRFESHRVIPMHEIDRFCAILFAHDPQTHADPAALPRGIPREVVGALWYPPQPAVERKGDDGVAVKEDYITRGSNAGIDAGVLRNAETLALGLAERAKLGLGVCANRGPNRRVLRLAGGRVMQGSNMFEIYPVPETALELQREAISEIQREESEALAEATREAKRKAQAKKEADAKEHEEAKARHKAEMEAIRAADRNQTELERARRREEERLEKEAEKREKAEREKAATARKEEEAKRRKQERDFSAAQKKEAARVRKEAEERKRAETQAENEREKKAIADERAAARKEIDDARKAKRLEDAREREKLVEARERDAAERKREKEAEKAEKERDDALASRVETELNTLSGAIVALLEKRALAMSALEQSAVDLDRVRQERSDHGAALEELENTLNEQMGTLRTEAVALEECAEQALCKLGAARTDPPIVAWLETVATKLQGVLNVRSMTGFLGLYESAACKRLEDIVKSLEQARTKAEDVRTKHLADIALDVDANHVPASCGVCVNVARLTAPLREQAHALRIRVAAVHTAVLNTKELMTRMGKVLNGAGKAAKDARTALTKTRKQLKGMLDDAVDLGDEEKRTAAQLDACDAAHDLEKEQREEMRNTCFPAMRRIKGLLQPGVPTSNLVKLLRTARAQLYNVASGDMRALDDLTHTVTQTNLDAERLRAIWDANPVRAAKSVARDELEKLVRTAEGAAQRYRAQVAAGRGAAALAGKERRLHGDVEHLLGALPPAVHILPDEPSTETVVETLLSGAPGDLKAATSADPDVIAADAHAAADAEVQKVSLFVAETNAAARKEKEEKKAAKSAAAPTKIEKDVEKAEKDVEKAEAAVEKAETELADARDNLSVAHAAAAVQEADARKAEIKTLDERITTLTASLKSLDADETSHRAAANETVRDTAPQEFNEINARREPLRARLRSCADAMALVVAERRDQQKAIEAAEKSVSKCLNTLKVKRAHLKAATQARAAATVRAQTERKDMDTGAIDAGAAAVAAAGGSVDADEVAEPTAAPIEADVEHALAPHTAVYTEVYLAAEQLHVDTRASIQLFKAASQAPVAAAVAPIPARVVPVRADARLAPPVRTAAMASQSLQAALAGASASASAPAARAQGVAPVQRLPLTLAGAERVRALVGRAPRIDLCRRLKSVPAGA